MAAVFFDEAVARYQDVNAPYIGWWAIFLVLRVKGCKHSERVSSLKNHLIDLIIFFE